jgi:hypothetical protein
VTLAVANVHKEAVSVFLVRDGQLAFHAKVPPGEALDLPVTPGANLAATFSTAPYCANYTAKGNSGEVWLLRPAVETSSPPTTCGPATTPPPAIRVTPLSR